MTTDIFVDGSALNNGKQNSVAGYGVFFPFHEHLSHGVKISDNKPSNNVGEIMACISAIDTCEKSLPETRKITIYSDSEYTINSITKWCATWEKNQWRKSDKKEIKNRELIKDLWEKYKRLPIEFIHVRSHTKEPENKNGIDYYRWYGNFMADKLARESL